MQFVILIYALHDIGTLKGACLDLEMMVLPMVEKVFFNHTNINVRLFFKSLIH